MMLTPERFPCEQCFHLGPLRERCYIHHADGRRFTRRTVSPPGRTGAHRGLRILHSAAPSLVDVLASVGCRHCGLERGPHGCSRSPRKQPF